MWIELKDRLINLDSLEAIRVEDRRERLLMRTNSGETIRTSFSSPEEAAMVYALLVGLVQATQVKMESDKVQT